MTKEQFLARISELFLARISELWDELIENEKRERTDRQQLESAKPDTLAEDKARIVDALESGPIVSIGGFHPVRDVLAQRMRARGGRGMQTARLGRALHALEVEGVIVWSKDHKRLSLADR